MDETADYLIRLRPQPGGVPPAVRLKRFLKSAWRGYHLRCITAEEVPAGSSTNRRGDRIMSESSLVAAVTERLADLVEALDRVNAVVQARPLPTLLLAETLVELAKTGAVLDALADLLRCQEPATDLPTPSGKERR
jgi:hypothetical protein